MQLLLCSVAAICSYSELTALSLLRSNNLFKQLIKDMEATNINTTPQQMQSCLRTSKVNCIPITTAFDSLLKDPSSNTNSNTGFDDLNRKGIQLMILVMK